MPRTFRNNYQLPTSVVARRTLPTHGLDPYWTPPSATRALCEHILWDYVGSGNMESMEAHDPACGEGFMADTLREYFHPVGASDIYHYGYGFLEDFLQNEAEYSAVNSAIITNPPFNKTTAFIKKALSKNPAVVAMLARAQLLEGAKRYTDLWNLQPPLIVAPFTQRVSMSRLCIDQKRSSATMYAWFIWFSQEIIDRMDLTDYTTRLVWIPPHIERWTHPSDPMKTEPLPEPELS